MKKRQFLTGMSALAILLTSCQGGGQETAQLARDGSGKITTEPTELTLFLTSTYNDKYLEELPVFQEIEKITNVRLKTTNSRSVSDEVTAFNTMIASADLPDMVIYGEGKEAFAKYGMEGAFEKLNDLIENETVNLKKEFENPNVRNFATAPDGNIYYIPGMNPVTVAAGWFVRQDWLDKLGLEKPTNMEEYYNMLVAFRDGDPNGNGLNDEVPYFSRFNGVDHLVYLWDAPLEWAIDENGKVYYGPASEAYKTAYENISKWYAENLIDKEIYTRGWKSRDKLLGDNVGGSTHDWFGSTAQFNDMLKDSVPGMNLRAIVPPNGKEYTIREEAIINGAAISAKSTKKEVAIKFLDFIFSEEGGRFMNFGVEGQQYDMVDSKPIFRDEVIHGEMTAINILERVGACTRMPYRQDFWYEEQWLNESAKEGARMYIDNNYLQEPFPVLSYTPEEKERLNEIMTQIKTLVSENTQKWVFGSQSIADTYDNYIMRMQNMGLDEATKIQQAAYDRYLNK